MQDISLGKTTRNCRFRWYQIKPTLMGKLLCVPGRNVRDGENFFLRLSLRKIGERENFHWHLICLRKIQILSVDFGYNNANMSLKSVPHNSILPKGSWGIEFWILTFWVRLGFWNRLLSVENQVYVNGKICMMPHLETVNFRVHRVCSLIIVKEKQFWEFFRLRLASWDGFGFSFYFFFVFFLCSTEPPWNRPETAVLYKYVLIIFIIN